MPEFIFFKKGNKTTALEKSDAPGAALLLEQGYEKQFEEVLAADSQRALARLADIKKEEVLTERAFMTWPAFAAAVFIIMLAVGYLFGN